eukprot:gene12483-biopygen5693
MLSQCETAWCPLKLTWAPWRLHGGSDVAQRYLVELMEAAWGTHGRPCRDPRGSMADHGGAMADHAGVEWIMWAPCGSWRITEAAWRVPWRSCRHQLGFMWLPWGTMWAPGRFRPAPKETHGAHGSVCEPHGGSYTAHGIASVNQVGPMEAPAGTPGGPWKPLGGPWQIMQAWSGSCGPHADHGV